MCHLKGSSLAFTISFHPTPPRQSHDKEPKSRFLKHRTLRGQDVVAQMRRLLSCSHTTNITAS